MSYNIIVLDDHLFEEKHPSVLKCDKKSNRKRKTTMQLLQCRNDVLSTLCGFQKCKYVMDAVVKIQSVTRGWILRYDKLIFDSALSTLIRKCKAFLEYRRFHNMKKAAILLQSHWRRIVIQKTTICKCISIIIKQKREIIQLELLTLKLSNA